MNNLKDKINLADLIINKNNTAQNVSSLYILLDKLLNSDDNEFAKPKTKEDLKKYHIDNLIRNEIREIEKISIPVNTLIGAYNDDVITVKMIKTILAKLYSELQEAITYGIHEIRYDEASWYSDEALSKYKQLIPSFDLWYAQKDANKNIQYIIQHLNRNNIDVMLYEDCIVVSVADK